MHARVGEVSATPGSAGQEVMRRIKYALMEKREKEMGTKKAGRDCEGLGRCFDASPFMWRLDGWRSEGKALWLGS